MLWLDLGNEISHCAQGAHARIPVHAPMAILATQAADTPTHTHPPARRGSGRLRDACLNAAAEAGGGGH